MKIKRFLGGLLPFKIISPSILFFKGPTEAGVGQKASYTLQLRASNPEDSALASLESRLSDLEVIFLPTLFQIYLS